MFENIRKRGNMKLKLYILLIIAFMASCQSNDKNKSKNANGDPSDGTTEHVLTNTEKLQDYILALDSTDIQSVSKATDKFKDLFEKKDTLENDKGVAAMIDYMEKVAVYANSTTFEYGKNYSALSNIEFQGGGKSVPSELSDEYDLIHENGFRVRQTEGMYDLELNPLYLQEKFYPYISGNFEIYLQKLGKENMEGFAEDAAIAIPYQSLVQRVIWWEEFAESNKNSIVGERARIQYQRYFEVLTIGMDNTPAIESEQIAAYFLDAYTYLKEFAINSNTYKRLQPYISLLEQEKIEEAKLLVPDLLAKDKI